MTNMHRTAVLLLLVVGTVSLSARAELTLKDTDRVVCFSDAAFSDAMFSMTLDQFLRLKYPQLKAEIITLGLLNTNSEDGSRRLVLEVLPLKPTVVVLCFGLEDGDRKAFDQERLDNYIAQMTGMMDAITKAGARIVVMTPPRPEASRMKSLARAEYDKVVGEYAVAVTKLATDRGLPVLDWYGAATKYRREGGRAARLRLTKHGIIPAGPSVVLAVDLLLSHWQAEPIEFLISADWKSDAVQATSGSASAVKRTDERMVLALKGVPIPLVMLGRGTTPSEAWPMSKWCSYRLKVTNMPPGGAIISEPDGKNGKPFLGEQLANGADLSSIGPLATHPATDALIRAIGRTIDQFRKFRNSCNRKMTEPEFEEAYALFREAEKTFGLAYYKVLLRTPKTLDATLWIDLVKKPSAEPDAQTPAKPKP